MTSERLARETREALEQQLGRIEASRSFTRCDRLIQLLRFVCIATSDGRADELKETVVAVAVFSRPPDYDPKKDSIVRTEASRLRKRLREYYETEGQFDPVRIDLPAGSYLPVLEFERPVRAAASGVNRWMLAAAIAGVALLMGAWIWMRRDSPEIVVAVMPFENLSGESSMEYLGQSVSRDVHYMLTGVERLRLIGRATVSQFGTGGAALPEAARQVQSDYFLTGAVRRVGGRVTLRAELTRSRDMTEVWSFGTAEDEAAGLDQLEERVARQVANALRRKLGNLRRKYDADPELVDRFRQADYYLSSFRAPEAKKAIPILEEIIQKDASFAPAHAALAHALLNASYNHAAPIQEAEARMEQLARRALELDPLLADSYSALGFLEMRRYHWREAEERFRHAIRLDPNSSLAYYGLGFGVFTKSGRFQEAEEVLRAGLRLDPLSERLSTSLVITLHFSGQCEKAVAAAARLLANGNPMVSLTAVGITARCACAESREKAMAEMKKRLASDFKPYCLAKYGLQDEAKAAFEAKRNDLFVEMTYYAGIRDSDRLLTILEREWEEGSPSLPFHLLWPEFYFLRSDPRYLELRRKIGLPMVRTNP